MDKLNVLFYTFIVSNNIASVLTGSLNAFHQKLQRH